MTQREQSWDVTNKLFNAVLHPVIHTLQDLHDKIVVVMHVMHLSYTANDCSCNACTGTFGIHLAAARTGCQPNRSTRIGCAIAQDFLSANQKSLPT